MTQMPEESYSDSQWAQADLDETLIARINSAMDRAIRTWINDPDERADVIHDTWLEILKCWASLRDRQKAVPWAVTIARRSARGKLRRREREREALNCLDLSVAWRTEDAPPEWSEAQVDWVVWALSELPHPQQLVLIQKYYSGLTAAEIGRFLGQRPESIRQAQHRAKEALKAKWGSESSHQQLQITLTPEAPLLSVDRLIVLIVERCLDMVSTSLTALKELDDLVYRDNHPEALVVTSSTKEQVRRTISWAAVQCGRLRHQAALMRSLVSSGLRAWEEGIDDKGSESAEQCSLFGSRSTVCVRDRFSYR